jgi:replicative DNA helicase
MSQDPINRFYYQHLNVTGEETVVTDCPFCRTRGEKKLVLYLHRESFFHGYFRCLNRCVPGGFPMWFAHLMTIPKADVPDYNPEWEFEERQPDFPVENLNKEIDSYSDRMTDEIVEYYRQHGVMRGVLSELKIGFNGRYLVYPYIQEDGNCYSARCVYPGKGEDYFWHGVEEFSREPFNLYSAGDLRCCENGALFLCEGEENLLTLKQLGFPGVAVAHYQALERLPAKVFARIRTVFICIGNTPESELAARNLASRIGFKARILSWANNAPRRYNLWTMARETGNNFSARVTEMIRSSRAFSPFPPPRREFSLCLQNLENQQSVEYQAMVSGFSLFDAALGGVHGINVFGGAPKAGKSTFMIQIASTMAGQGVPVLYYDFENGRQKIYQRTLCRMARVEAEKLADESLDSSSLARLQRAKEELAKMLFYWRVINDRKLTPELMRKHIDFIRHETRSKYTVVVIDSLHKLPFNQFAEMRTGIDAWLRQLESIRDEMQVSFLVISELSRDSSGSYREEPHLGVFKGSGDIEYSADNAMVLYPATTNMDHGERRNTLWLVASREHSPGRVAEYHLDFPYWGFIEKPV